MIQRRTGLELTRRALLARGFAGAAVFIGGPVVAGCGGSDSPSGGSGGGDGGGGRGDGGASGSGGADGGAAGLGGSPADAGVDMGPTVSNIDALGPLGDPDANGVRVPEGFSVRIVARSGERPADGSDYVWHVAPDGGATFQTESGGWIYVSNSEWVVGGVGAIEFDASGAIVRAYSICEGTTVNCAGGKMPWGVWLTCEEVGNGTVFDCDPMGLRAAIPLPALGIFKHEAAQFEPVHRHVYLTEDEGDGRFYRFIPDGDAADGTPDLTAGRLEVASVADSGAVSWLEVPDPSAASMPTRNQVPDSTAFQGGEGLWYHEGVVYFSTKLDNRVWAYDVTAENMTVLYDAKTEANPVLTGVDNLSGNASGDILVAEDGGDMQIVAITRSGELVPLVQVTGQDGSEITGPAFDPTGTRLYFSSQRALGTAFNAGGITYEITGPFLRQA